MWYCGFSNLLTRRVILAMIILCASGCVSLGKDQKTADGQTIPAKRFLDFREYEYICEPIMDLDLKQLEQRLDRYGQNGFRLGGILNKDGHSYAFCVMR